MCFDHAPSPPTPFRSHPQPQKRFPALFPAPRGFSSFQSSHALSLYVAMSASLSSSSSPSASSCLYFRSGFGAFFCRCSLSIASRTSLSASSSMDMVGRRWPGRKTEVLICSLLTANDPCPLRLMCVTWMPGRVGSMAASMALWRCWTRGSSAADCGGPWRSLLAPPPMRATMNSRMPFSRSMLSMSSRACRTADWRDRRIRSRNWSSFAEASGDARSMASTASSRAAASFSFLNRSILFDRDMLAVSADSGESRE
mmetsp:Transcript_9640/g.27334  ORF Transcript_9640/g.27334 Transcript_9640/m.27334 type:complete len:256 (+) Transcript_9640:197-964(+)